MRVHVSNDLDDLKNDLTSIARQTPKTMHAVVARNVRSGNTIAKNLARKANGPDSHARKYPGSFTAAMGSGFRGAEVSVYSGEFGPRNVGQGALAPILENGSRSGNAPQHNLARAADIIGPRFADDVADTAAGLFWPAS